MALSVQILKHSCEYGHNSPLFLLSHREKLYGACASVSEK